MIGQFDTGARRELVRRLLNLPDGTALVRLLADHDEAVRWGTARASREEAILVDCSCDAPGCTEQVELGFSSDSDSLLARPDAAAPARDDALDRWIDGEIDDASRDLRESEREVELNGDRNVTAVADAEWIAGRLGALREVRDRLGATTNTTPEGGADEH